MGSRRERTGKVEVSMDEIARRKETYEQSVELTDTLFTLLDLLIDYCKSHNIPMYQEQGIWNMFNRAQNIMKQIEYANSATLPNINRRKVTDFDNSQQGKRTLTNVLKLRFQNRLTRI